MRNPLAHCLFTVASLPWDLCLRRLSACIVFPVFPTEKVYPSVLLCEIPVVISDF